MSIHNETLQVSHNQNETLHPIVYSYFETESHTKAELIDSDFQKLESLCSNPIVSTDKTSTSFSPVVFVCKCQNTDSAISASFLAFDLDDLPENVTAKGVLSCIPGIRAFCYSTFSHKMDGKGARFRVLMALKEVILASQYTVLAKTVAKKFMILDGKVDKACFSPAHYLHFPTTHPDRVELFEFLAQGGEALDGLAVIKSIKWQQPVFLEIN